MTTDKQVSDSSRENGAAGERRQPAMRPSVDIFENGDSITLQASVPGVSQDTLKIQVDDKTLEIEGDIDIDMPSDLTSLYADVRATRYQRAFTLSGELDTTRIDAKLTDGLLSVVIPKRDEVRPRKIEVQVG